MKIRRAAEGDATGVARVHVQTWQAAYRGIVPDAYLDSLSIPKRAQIWSETIFRGVPELWVAEIQAEIVGWIAFGPSRDADAAPGVSEVEAIYVAPQQWSRGIGRELWNVARRRLVERSFSSAMLWVLVDNERAIRFYRKAGFQPDLRSVKEIAIGGKALMEMRYETQFAHGGVPEA